MKTALGILALVANAAVALPVLVLFVECVAAVLWRPRKAGGPDVPARTDAAAPRTVVLIPAHDEQELIGTTLAGVLPQLAGGDRALVVAHNCSDGTGEVARAHGADVVEARDAGTGGKPDALKAGLSALDADPPDVVVVVDADCSVGPDAIPRLARAAAASGGPVMGVYLFQPAGGGGRQSISSLALLVKNHVRPLGLHALGLPCLLNGSGSAYPYRQLRDAPHGEGSIAEDYQLAIDLLERGHPTRFVPDARVDSRLPGREGVALKQRRRWEHGHLWLVFRTAPGLILRGLAQRSVARVALGLELLVPPLAFLVLAFGAALGAGALAAWVGGPGSLGWAALVLGLATGLTLFTGLVAAFVRFLGPRQALVALLSIPGYVLWKVPLYLGFPARREQRWSKTER